jgi:hypothetical protein
VTAAVHHRFTDSLYQSAFSLCLFLSLAADCDSEHNSNLLLTFASAVILCFDPYRPYQNHDDIHLLSTWSAWGVAVGSKQ